MILNTWTVRWNGHLIEVRNHFFVAELLVDGERVAKAPGVFRHELRAALNGAELNRLGRPCSHESCRHGNRLEARFCANCGAELNAHGAEHSVLATVEFCFPPHVGCRILVDGEEILKED